MFSILEMGTNFMLGSNSYVPLTTNNFEVRIYGRNDTTESFEALTLATDEIGEIVEEQDVITVHYGNGLIKFPSKVSFADVDWTLNCYCTPDILGQLRSWRDQVFDPITEKMGLPTQYMRDAYFIRYDGQGNPRSVLKAPRVWVRSLKYGAMNQQGGDLVKLGITLVISKVFWMNTSDSGLQKFAANTDRLQTTVNNVTGRTSS